MLPTFTGAELLTLADWIAMSPVPEVLRLFKHENDIGWDARHLWASILTHPIVHALYLYAKKNLPNHYVQILVSLYRSQFNSQKEDAVEISSSTVKRRKGYCSLIASGKNRQIFSPGSVRILTGCALHTHC